MEPILFHEIDSELAEIDCPSVFALASPLSTAAATFASRAEEKPWPSSRAGLASKRPTGRKKGRF
jgi:hypothetical protein